MNDGPLLNHSIFVHETDKVQTVETISNVKLEVIEPVEPLHLYFTNGIARAKVENGEIHLTLDQLNGAGTKYKKIYISDDQTVAGETQIEVEKSPTGRKSYQQFYRKVDNKWICLSCNTQYDSTHGIHYHLNHTICGFGDKERVAPKKDFRGYYTRDNDKFVCLGCSQRYETIRGVHYHLNNKKCGKLSPDQFQIQPVFVLPQVKPEETPPDGGIKIASPKRNYLKFYKKQDKVCICFGCGSRYHSIHGMHNHLNSTKCGFGEKFRSTPKTSYTQFYRKEEDKLICNCCNITYNSMHGMHYHLNSTKCGFGAKDRVATKRSYQDFYTKENKSFVCNHCHYRVEYLQGIHRHLRNCPGYNSYPNPSEPSLEDTTINIDKSPKIVKTIIYSENENMNYIGHDASL